MTKKRKRFWIVLGVGTLVVLWVAYNFVLPFVLGSRARARVLNADHQDLLAGCREMVRDRDHYAKAWQSPWALWGRDTGPLGEDVPQIIRDMRPLYIEIYTNRVLVKVHIPPRVAFMGFAEGVDDAWVKERGGWMLTNGLWYCP